MVDNVEEMIHDVRGEDEMTKAELRKYKQFVEDSKKPLYPHCEKSIYQNSGVRIDAYDNNMQKAPYYDQIKEIWELNYLEFKVALFKC